MLRKCLGAGLLAARNNPGLAAVLWVWGLVLGGIAAFPAWFWLGQAFNLRPESDRLLTGFNLAVFTEALQYDRSPVFRVVLSVLLGVLALAVAANPFVSGGLLAALRGDDGESTPMRRFWSGGGTHYWRFLRLLMYALLCAIPLMAAASGAFAPLVDWFDDRRWEHGVLVGRLFPSAAGLLVGAWIVLALDLARVRTVLDEGSGPLRNWFWALLCVWRRPVVVFGLLISMAGLFAVVAGVYTAATGGLPSSAWTAILAMILLQQIVMFTRSALRVGLVGGELAFCRQLLPPAPPAPAPPPEPGGPSPDTPEPVAAEAQAPEAPHREEPVESHGEPPFPSRS